MSMNPKLDSNLERNETEISKSDRRRKKELFCTFELTSKTTVEEHESRVFLSRKGKMLEAKKKVLNANPGLTLD